VALIGASGLNILGGLDVPTSGEVRFADHVLTGASEAELTRARRAAVIDEDHLPIAAAQRQHRSQAWQQIDHGTW
jgi:hypothetical protein